MPLDPKNYRTWTAFSDHPIFGNERASVAKWSHDASRYCELKGYGAWMPEGYVHVEPPPALEIQLTAAKQDIEELSACCQALEGAFGRITHELIILDDFTVYVWAAGDEFSIDFYPNLLEPGYRFLVFFEKPNQLDEVRCKSYADVVTAVRKTLSK